MSYFAGDEENDIPPDQPEDNETEDGPFTVRDKLNQLFPDGVHCVFIGKTYAEAWSESMDDGLVIGFPYEGDGMAREAIMDDSIVIQDFFNDIMNSMREAQDLGWPRTYISAEDEEFDAIQDQRSEPYAFALKKARNGQALEADFFREPDLVLPASLVQMMEYSSRTVPAICAWNSAGFVRRVDGGPENGIRLRSSQESGDGSQGHSVDVGPVDHGEDVLSRRAQGVKESRSRRADFGSC